MTIRLADWRSHRAWSVAAGIIVCGLVAGGVALATIPDSNGVLHGCYQKSSGNLRIIDTSVANCRPSETAISWNATGPAGDVGPRGPSNAFYKDQSDTFGSESLNLNTFIKTVTLSLPAGSYVVNATAAFGSGVAFNVVQCQIQWTGGSGPAVQGTIGGSANSFLVMPLMSPVTLAATDDVSIACRGGSDVNTQPSAITAIQVETVTIQ